VHHHPPYGFDQAVVVTAGY